MKLPKSIDLGVILKWTNLIGALATTSNEILSHRAGPDKLILVAFANTVLEKVDSPIRITILEKKR